LRCGQKKAAGTVEISSPEEERKLMKGKKNSKRKSAFIDHTKAGRQVDELSEEKREREKTRIQSAKIQFCYTIFNMNMNILITLHCSKRYAKKIKGNTMKAIRERNA